MVWGKGPDEIKKARQARRDLFTPMQLKNPWIFVQGDYPLETLAPPQQDMAQKQFEKYAGAEGSALQDKDWESLIDPTVSIGANVQTLLDNGAREPESEREKSHLTDEEAEEMEIQRAHNEIMSWCEQMDEANIDGATVMEALLADRDVPELEEAEAQGFDVGQVGGLLGDVQDAFGFDVVQDAIVECRNELQGPSFEEESYEIDLLHRLRENFDIGPATSVDSAFEAIQEQIDTAEAHGRAQALNRFQRAFGVRFESIDDAINRLQDRIEKGKGPSVRSGTVRVYHKEGDERPSVNIRGEADFSPYKGQVRERVEAELDWRNIQSAGWVGVGHVRLEDDELVSVDLSEGREKIGATGPRPGPARVAGWYKTSEAEDEVRYEKNQPMSTTDGVVGTGLVIREAAGGWAVERQDLDADGDVVDSQVAHSNVPDRETALDHAERFMDDHPFDPDAQPVDVAAEMDELTERAEFGIDRLYDETDPATLADVATAIENETVDEDSLARLATAIENFDPYIISLRLAEEQEDADRRTEFRTFLEAIPGYSPPEARGHAGPEPVEFRDPEQQRVFDEVRESLQTVPPTFQDDPIEYYERMIRALERGDASDIHISQADFDRLSTDDRDELLEIAHAQFGTAESTEGIEDFPGVGDAVEQAWRSTLAYVNAVIEELEQERDPHRIPADEIKRIQRAPDAKEAALDQLRERKRELESDDRRGDRSRRPGGRGGGRGQDPGMGEDEFREFQEEAARRQAGGPSGGRGRGAGGGPGGGPRRDESRVDDSVVERWSPQVEETFLNLAKDVGWRRKFDAQNPDLYFRLTPRQQRQRYDFTPEEFMAYLIRKEEIGIANLRNRGFPDRVIQDVQEEI